MSQRIWIVGLGILAMALAIATAICFSRPRNQTEATSVVDSTGTELDYTADLKWAKGTLCVCKVVLCSPQWDLYADGICEYRLTLTANTCRSDRVIDFRIAAENIQIPITQGDFLAFYGDAVSIQAMERGDILAGTRLFGFRKATSKERKALEKNLSSNQRPR